MRQSQLFGSTRKELPKDEASKNAILLMRGGYVSKSMAGVYSYLPLGLKVIQNLSRIVREELGKLPYTQEILMPSLQSRELWEESGRWEEIQEVMYTVEEGKMGLGPTHEEVVTDLFRQFVSSYREVPVGLYQIQTKFRNEPRAKSGLLRGREFLMKDLYSFHTTEAGLDEYYDLVTEAYFRIYNRCGLKAIFTEAAGGVFTKFSHEFQVVAEAGEDTIYYKADGTMARNKELVPSEEDPEILEYCGGSIKKDSAIEVGNIFKLKNKFSTPMGAQVSLEGGEKVDMWMGCYGLGISRLMGTMVEALGSDAKMIWPEGVAPFDIHVIDLTQDAQGEAVYETLSKNRSVIYDDRERSAGEKFADADLMGSPIRVIVSKRSLASGGVEVKNMLTDETKIVSIADLGSL